MPTKFKPSYKTEPFETIPAISRIHDLYDACESMLTPWVVAVRSKVHFLIARLEIGYKIEENQMTIPKLKQIINDSFLLLWAWHTANQEAAIKLILILKVNVEFIENLYNDHLKDKDFFNQDIPNQIAQTQVLITKILDAKELGIDMGRLFFAFPQGLEQKISTFLFEPQSLNMRAFDAGRAFIRARLTTPTPVSKSITWMKDFLNEANWRRWEHEYNSHPSNTGKTECGYGPGAMMRCLD